MVWNFEFPSFLLCPTIPFLQFWSIRKTGQIISIWTQFQQMLKIIEIAHMYSRISVTRITIILKDFDEISTYSTGRSKKILKNTPYLKFIH